MIPYFLIKYLKNIKLLKNNAPPMHILHFQIFIAIDFTIFTIRNHFNVIRNRKYSITICSYAIDFVNFNPHITTQWDK